MWRAKGKKRKKWPRDVEHLTLTQLEGSDWGPAPEGSTGLVEEIHHLRYVPLGELDDEGYRMLLTQRVSQETIVPRALAAVEWDPALSGDRFEGAVLSSLLRAGNSYWDGHPEERDRVKALLDTLERRAPEIWEDGYIQGAIRAFRLDAGLPGSGARREGGLVLLPGYPPPKRVSDENNIYGEGWYAYRKRRDGSLVLSWDSGELVGRVVEVQISDEEFNRLWSGPDPETFLEISRRRERRS